jgi:hypothetical protein
MSDPFARLRQARSKQGPHRGVGAMLVASETTETTQTTQLGLMGQMMCQSNDECTKRSMLQIKDQSTTTDGGAE